MRKFEHESFLIGLSEQSKPHFFTLDRRIQGNGNGYQTETYGAFPESSHIIFQYTAGEESVALEKESLAS